MCWLWEQASSIHTLETKIRPQSQTGTWQMTYINQDQHISQKAAPILYFYAGRRQKRHICIKVHVETSKWKKWRAGSLWKSNTVCPESVMSPPLWRTIYEKSFFSGRAKHKRRRRQKQQHTMVRGLKADHCLGRGGQAWLLWNLEEEQRCRGHLWFIMTLF